MDTRKRSSLILVAGLLMCGCAPTDQPTAKVPGPTVVAENGAAEKIDIAPTPVLDGPRYRIEAAIQNVRHRDLLTTNGFWTIFHGILGLGPSVTLRNPDTGQRVNALDYICNGGELRGLKFDQTDYGADVEVITGGVGQGHQDQFIAEMGEWGMPADRTFRVHGKTYAFLDFVRHAQMRASPTHHQELSWALVVIGDYLGTDIAWTNMYGEKLRYEDLVRYELDASVDEAPCGGTHRLFGLTWAYYLHLRNGGKTAGIWQEVVAKTAKHRDLAKQYQNADGSFSTSFFRGPGNATDKQLRINTTGHTLEWLSLALSDSEMKEQWVQDAANALSMMILDQQDSPIESGSLYHATHGLLLYYARVYDHRWLGPNDPVIPLPPQQTTAHTP
jgi:hypothetical protein